VNRRRRAFGGVESPLASESDAKQKFEHKNGNEGELIVREAY